MSAFVAFISDHAVDLVTSLLGLACVVLAGRNSKYNFWVGYVYTIALFVMFMGKNLYANLLLQPVSMAINILGHYRWTHPKKEEESRMDSSKLRVSTLSWQERILAIVSIFILAGAWGWLLDSWFPDDPHPYLDTCVTVLILMAQFFSALKKWDCWVAWLVVNITQIIMHIAVGNVFMPIVCGLYLLNGLWSIVTWVRLYRKEED